MAGKKILIVGGVAGGGSCAARARRLNEKDEIIIFERGQYVSFANCGLPYYVGQVIKKEYSLLVATPKLFKERFNIDVRLQNEVMSIDRENSAVLVKNLKTKETYNEHYDILVLAPGASPIRPDLPGLDLPGIFYLRTIPDSRDIKKWIVNHKVKQAVVVGGGFIGLEITENLQQRGIKVTLIELESHVMPTLDREMAIQINAHLETKKINLLTEEAVAGFEQKENHQISLQLRSGRKIETDMVVMAIGVQPEVKLAEEAGLEIGERGIRVDNKMRTSYKNIFAVGDAIEVRDTITNQWSLKPLAGPANRQGRIAADVINGRDSSFRGSQGTYVCGVLGMIIAATGLTEKELIELKGTEHQIEYEKVYIHSYHHADYYPDAERIALKLLFSTKDGKILGAQGVGMAGVEKRIDVISTAIQFGGTVYDLEEVELCYSPQYGSAKDPVNLIGMVASNVLRGDTKIAHWDKIDDTDAYIIDVREPFEYRMDNIDEAVNIPLETLRARMGELPKDKEIWLYCFVGQRSYFGTRLLSQNGFNVKSLSGGFRTFSLGEEL